MRSLRSQILLGSAIAAVGVAAVSHLFAAFLIRLFPEAPRVGHYLLLALAAVLFIAFGLAGMRSGLALLDRLRERLAAVRSGRDQRLGGEYPIEIQPLVDELNALLEHREQSVQRARAKAGDLAHGLKTPLALLLQQAEQARTRGDEATADAIAKSVDGMRRQIDYHLAQARAAASSARVGVRCLIEPSVSGLERALTAIHGREGVGIEVDLQGDLAFRGEREDFEEMLGNLLENACKWGRERVVLRAARSGGEIVVTVDDDGPGLEPELRRSVLRRGVRADESAPGSGLGLAIVRDLAELYGGSIALETSPSGGVRARLELPAA